MLEYHITREFGHPWHTKTRPSFDLLEVRSDTEIELHKFVAKAECKKCSGCGFMNVYDPGYYHPDVKMPDDEICDVCNGSGLLK